MRTIKFDLVTTEMIVNGRTGEILVLPDERLDAETRKRLLDLETVAVTTDGRPFREAITFTGFRWAD